MPYSAPGFRASRGSKATIQDIAIKSMQETKNAMKAHSRDAHGASDQRVPKAAKAKSAIGRRQIGRFSAGKNDPISRVGTRVSSHATAKMATRDVDQGSASAVRITKTSADRIQALGARSEEPV